MNTLYTCAGMAFAIAVFATVSLEAQTASKTNYDFLNSISEPVRFDLYERSVQRPGSQVVPMSAPAHASIDLSHPLPPLAEQVSAFDKLTVTEHLQLATAFRLRGDYVQAVPHYAQIMKLSKQPIHAFFYAQALRATGQDLLADLYDARYAEGTGGSLEHTPGSISERSGIPVMIYGRVTDRYDGNPVAHAEVRLVNLCTEEELVTTTDMNGNFRFKEHPADCRYVIRFEKRRFETIIVESAAPHKDQRVDIELEGEHDLSFR